MKSNGRRRGLLRQRIRKALRGSTVAVVMLAMLGVSHPPAIADAVVKVSATYFTAGCADLVSSGRPVQFFLDQDVEQQAGSIAIWPEGTDPNSDPPSIVSDGFRMSVEGTNPARVSGDLSLIDPDDGAPLGSARFDVLITQLAEPQGTSKSLPGHRFNIITLVDLSIADAAIEGTVSLPDGGIIELSGCNATLGTQSVSQTRPRAIAGQDLPFSGALCTIESSGTWIEAFMYGGETLGAVEMTVITPSGDGMFGMAELEVGGDRLWATVDMFDFEGRPAGQTTIDTTFVDLGRERVIIEVDGIRFRRHSDLFALAGTITVPDGTEVSTEGCEGSSSKGWVLATPRGPRG